MENTEQHKFDIILEYLKSNQEALKLLWQKIDILERELNKKRDSDFEKPESKKINLSQEERRKRRERWTKMIEKAREKYPNAWKSWSEEQDKELLELYRDKKTLEEISNKMGRHPNSIRARLENKHGVVCDIS